MAFSNYLPRLASITHPALQSWEETVLLVIIIFIIIIVVVMIVVLPTHVRRMLWPIIRVARVKMTFVFIFILAAKAVVRAVYGMGVRAVIIQPIVIVIPILMVDAIDLLHGAISEAILFSGLVGFVEAWHVVIVIVGGTPLEMAIFVRMSVFVLVMVFGTPVLLSTKAHLVLGLLVSIACHILHGIGSAGHDLVAVFPGAIIVRVFVVVPTISTVITCVWVVFIRIARSQRKNRIAAHCPVMLRWLVVLRWLLVRPCVSPGEHGVEAVFMAMEAVMFFRMRVVAALTVSVHAMSFRWMLGNSTVEVIVIPTLGALGVTPAAFVLHTVMIQAALEDALMPAVTSVVVLAIVPVFGLLGWIPGERGCSKSREEACNGRTHDGYSCYDFDSSTRFRLRGNA